MELDTAFETFISKLIVENKRLYIKVTWKQNHSELFHIQIFDGDFSWSGRYSNEFAKRFRERDNISENEDVYATNVKKCLSGEDENYIFDFTLAVLDGDAASFGWKRRYKGVNILHGTVPVHRDAYPEPKETLVDTLLLLNNELKTDMKDLNRKTESLSVELEKCKIELEKYVNIKTSLETTLYGKFVQLLNAKKRRIQLLEDNLLNFEEPNNIVMASELD